MTFRKRLAYVCAATLMWSAFFIAIAYTYATSGGNW